MPSGRWWLRRRLHLWRNYPWGFYLWSRCVNSMSKDVPVHSTNNIGVISLGDIMEILPFEDPIVVLEVDGETIWAALESALSTWPAQEGYG